MRPFTYHRAGDPSAAIQALAVTAAGGNSLTEAAIQPLAGGTTLIDLMKLDVMRPSTLVDINPLAGTWSQINLEGDNLKLGALVRMSDVAAHPEVQRFYPVVADSLKPAASPQLRNMAALGAMSCSGPAAPISATSAMPSATSAVPVPAPPRWTASTGLTRCGDDQVNPAGVKGFGELANVGTNAAICNAIFNAIGQRIRKLPVRLENIGINEASSPR